MFNKFIKIAGALSLIAFSVCSALALYFGFIEEDTGIVIIPFIVSGFLSVVFVPWAEHIKEKEYAQHFCNDLRLISKAAIEMEQNKKSLSQ